MVIEKGMEIVSIIVTAYFAFVCVVVFLSELRAKGKSLIPMILTFLGICGLRVIWIAGL